MRSMPRWSESLLKTRVDPDVLDAPLDCSEDERDPDAGLTAENVAHEDDDPRQNAEQERGLERRQHDAKGTPIALGSQS